MRQNMRLRCWDKKSNKMLPSFPLYKACFAHDERTADMIIMLGTGLKDRHGKEIYEGDILKDIENNNIEEVKGFDFSFGWKQHLNYKEVIGNIHENGTCKVTPDGAPVVFP